MISGVNPPKWLFWLSVVALTSKCASAVLIAADLLSRPSSKNAGDERCLAHDGLYLDPLAVAAYWMFGRAPTGNQHNGAKRQAAKPFWQVCSSTMRSRLCETYPDGRGFRLR